AAARPDAPYGAFPLTVTEDGRLRAGFLDASQDLPAAALPGHLLGALSDLVLDAASGQDHPIPPAQESWARGTDAAGGIVTTTTVAPVPRAGESTDEPEPADATPVLVSEPDGHVADSDDHAGEP